MPAKSEKQKTAARIAMAAKKGEIPKSKLKGASKEMASGMTKKQLGHYTESLSTKLDCILFESSQQCLACVHYCGDECDDRCNEKKDVVKAHGIDRFDDWVKYPDDLNGCSYYKTK